MQDDSISHNAARHDVDAAVPLIYILHSGSMFGTERMALRTLRSFSERQQRLLVAPQGYAEGGSVLASASASGAIPIEFRGTRSLLLALLPFFRARRRIDIIATGVSQSLVCILLAAVFRVRLRHLHVIHGGTNELQSYGRKKLLSWFNVGLVGVSSFVAGRLRAYGIAASRIMVVPNFLAQREIEGWPRRASFADRPRDPDAVRIALVMRVDAIKRVDILVAAIRKYGLRDFQFHVYGTGTDLGHWRAATEDLPNLAFHGFVPDVPVRMAAADLLLHLCPEEPFGLVALEAFAARVPVMVPDAGGISELVEDDVSGFKYVAADVDSLAQGLRRVAALADSALDNVTQRAAQLLTSRYGEQMGVDRYRRALVAMDKHSEIAERSD